MDKEFYRFRPEDKKGCVRIRANVSYDTLTIIDEDTPLKRVSEFKVVKGKKWFDLIQFEDSLNFAISERLKNILQAHKFTGWKCFPIEIEQAIQNYFVFQNVGKAGPILNLDALNNYETDITEFDLNTWDRSDIFNLKETILNACVPSVKHVIEQNKITNIEIALL